MRGRAGWRRCLCALLALLIILPSLAEWGTATAQPSGRPNIILIVTDDQDFASLQHLPEMRRLADEGMSFENFLVTTPICCPSRTTILRGQYTHNHGVRYNFAPGGAFDAFKRNKLGNSTVATWLQAAGYRTGFYGKFLNGYPGGIELTWQPRGWNEWAAISRGHYVNYTLNVNGKPIKYGKKKKDYLTTVLGRRANSMIGRSAKADKPFFAMIAPQAAHNPLIPEARFRGEFAAVQAPRGPAFGEPDVSDKPSWVRQWPAMTPDRAAKIDKGYRGRLELLMSVDAMIGRLRASLEKHDLAQSTYIIVTSDNGWLAGAHNTEGKQSAFPESIRVPAIVWGPGVPAGTVERRIVLSNDLAPTLADLAGATVPAWVDGRSFAPLLRGEDLPWRTGALIEYWRYPGGGSDEERRRWQEAAWDGDLPSIAAAMPGPLPPTYRALRTEDALYVEYETGDAEYYDIAQDPHYLCNLLGDTSTDQACVGLSAPGHDELDALADRLDALATCSAAACRAAEDGD